MGVYRLTSWCTRKPSPPHYKMLKLLFKKQIRNTWKVLKCGGGKWHRRSAGQIMWKMKYYSQLNILHTIERKAHRIGHILCRNCLQRHVIDRKMERRTEVLGRQENRSMQHWHDLKEMRGYWELKGEALYHTLWRIPLGRSYGPVIYIMLISKNLPFRVLWL